jgi:hypothetical protein
MSETAMAFFDACETGKGWDVCQAWCHADASFACQAATLAEISTLKDYTEWMKGLFTPLPDLTYEIAAFATDVERNAVAVYGIVHGTQTGAGGPAPPTGNAVTADYVYVMRFDGDKIRHMTKIWKVGHTLKQLGWA